VTALASTTCGALTRSGRACQLPAGHGTDHVGFGKCRRHAGNTPGGRVYAAKLAALAELPPLGGEVDINPLEALLYTVRRAYALAGYYRLQAEARDLAGEDVEPYATLERQALGDLNQWAQRSVGAGVAERMVRIAERTGGILAAALEDALSGAELSASERSAVVARFAQALSRLERDAPAITAKAEDV
jgi:hypothetical protein